MEFKIAVASSDRRRVDTPFGKTEQLYIRDNRAGAYSFLEHRRLRPGDLKPEVGTATGSCGCGHGLLPLFRSRKCYQAPGH